MNWDQVEGKWKEFSGKARSKWGDLTDDDLQKAKGNREAFEGVLQQRLGIAKQQVREEIDQLLSQIG